MQKKVISAQSLSGEERQDAPRQCIILEVPATNSINFCGLL